MISFLEDMRRIPALFDINTEFFVFRPLNRFGGQFLHFHSLTIAENGPKSDDSFVTAAVFRTHQSVAAR